MKCNEYDKSKYGDIKKLENIDRALHDLGMLSAVTEARRDYLRESKADYCMMRLNTRYVSNVTVGYCMKKATHKHRLCPYELPVRNRTKSENSDAANSDISANNHDVKSLLDECSGSLSEFKVQTKRCHSLESLNINKEMETPELDCVSHQIQKLQVDE